MPEVRAALLAHAGRDAPHEVRRVHAHLSRPHDGRAVGDVRTSTTARPFEPLIPGVVVRRPTDDPRRSTRSSTTRTAAIIVEPIQGEGGVRPISAALAAAIDAACARTGALLIADEVQCGSGRTGTFLYSRTHRPHAGSRRARQGAWRAACRSAPRCSSADASRHAISPAITARTYGGNLLACRAALTFLDVLDGGLAGVDRARRRRICSQRLRELRRVTRRVVSEVRGAGLIAGLDLTVDAAPVVQPRSNAAC